MRNGTIKKAFPLLVVLVIVMGSAACSILQPKPEEGIWYCEELMIEIDFGFLNAKADPNCAKKYNPDGTYQNLLCYIDYGGSIWICSEDGTEDFLLGDFRYQAGVFAVTTREDSKTYVFERTGD